MQIKVYTDGGCSGNPGPGGWGFALVSEGKIIYDDAGKDRQTTNNKMELKAVFEALTYIKKTYENVDVNICTDSAYTMDSITKWAHGWKKKGWIKSDGKPIENPELIKGIYGLCYNNGLNVTFTKVKAHQLPGTRFYDPFNDHVDKLATGIILPGVR